MKKRNRAFAILQVVLLALILVVCERPAQAYVEIPYALGRLISESTNIVLVRMEKVDKERNLIVYRKVADIKGTHPGDVIKHSIGHGGFHPREWQFVMAGAEVGKMAVFCHNGSASETCIDNYWYQCYPGGEWWSMSHAEPYLLRTYAGKPEKLAAVIPQILAGKEVIVPCMVDGDKNALQLRTAKIQRLRASLKVQDYDQRRDFAGWGGDEYRQLAGMPAFMQYGAIGRVDPGACGVISADIDGDGKADLCVFGDEKVLLLRSAGNSMEEVSLPYTGGARAASFADYNGDGKPDLLLATPTGPRLFTNMGGSFKDASSALPKEPYYNLTAATFIDFDGNGKPDILLANGFLGLRLYRNLEPQAASDLTPKLGKWHYAGPFDNSERKGFNAVYPPETEIDLSRQYEGKGGEKVTWKQRDFNDSQVNDLALFAPENNVNAVVYLYREIECTAAAEMPLSLGSDDGLAVWLNGEKVVSEDVLRRCEPGQTRIKLKLEAGKNKLLIKVTQADGGWHFYFHPTPATSTPQLFEDISEKVGLGPNGIGSKVKGDRLIVADVNGDGRPDFLYCAGTGLLALNTPNGFVESIDSGIRFQPGHVAPVFGKLFGGTAPDLFIPQSGASKLLKNDGHGHFTDVSTSTGDLAKPLGNATSAVSADFNNRGQLDLLVGCMNGPNRYFKNNGNGSFTDATDEIGFYQKLFNTRGIAVADFNKDGILDVVMANEGQESAVLIGSPNRVSANTTAPKPTKDK